MPVNVENGGCKNAKPVAQQGVPQRIASLAYLREGAHQFGLAETPGRHVVPARLHGQKAVPFGRWKKGQNGMTDDAMYGGDVSSDANVDSLDRSVALRSYR